MSSDFDALASAAPNSDAASPAPSYGFAHPPPPAPPTLPDQQQWTQLPDLAHRRRCRCSRCWTSGRSWLASAAGVSVLLSVYLVTGAVMLMTLGSADNADDPTAGDANGRLEDHTLATVDRLWAITEDLNILYRDNWTQLARAEMSRYHDQLATTLRQILLDERYSLRQTWTLPMSLLYAVTLVTTIGYGFYTPTATLARGLTTLYSLVGIPLYLFYLSVVGERLASVINRIACSCCCCCCSCCDDRTPATAARRGSYRPYSDVSLALQPLAYGNGHALRVTQLDGKASRRRSPPAEPSNGGRAMPHGANRLPVVVCIGAVAGFVSLSALIIVLFEPQLSYLDSVHLTVNLLATLGFAGNLLPGTALDGQASSGAASQASLVVVSCIIVSGTTLLSASCSVIVDSFAGDGSGASGRRPTPTDAAVAAYRHVPSPAR